MEQVPAKTIVSARLSDSRWFGNDYNMNIYRGCCHACIYCDSRSDCYRITDFETVRAKEDALAIIERELHAKRRTGVIATGAMSDPYNPFEAEQELTRGAHALIDRFGFGVSIDTKGDLITRDIDVLSRIRVHSPVLVKLTVTTASDALANLIEPAAPPPSARLAAVEALSRAGIFAGVLMMPVLPFITDSEENIRELVRQAAEHAARFVYPSFGVTLRDSQRAHYYRMLDRHFPGLRAEYEKRFGGQYYCASPQAKRLHTLFAAECKNAGLLYRMGDIVRAYKGGYENEQMSLL